MAPDHLDDDRYLRCLDVIGTGHDGRVLSKGARMIFVWLAVHGGGPFDRLNDGISSVFGLGSGTIYAHLVTLEGAGLVRYVEAKSQRRGNASEPDEWMLTADGERAAAVVRSTWDGGTGVA